MDCLDTKKDHKQKKCKVIIFTPMVLICSQIDPHTLHDCVKSSTQIVTERFDRIVQQIAKHRDDEGDYN